MRLNMLIYLKRLEQFIRYSLMQMFIKKNQTRAYLPLSRKDRLAFVSQEPSVILSEETVHIHFDSALQMSIY